MRLLALAAVLGIVAGCGERPGFLRRATPYETYVQSLRDAGLDDTALVRDWLAAGERALREPQRATLPLESTTPFPAAEPRAFGYLLELRRGRVLRVEVTPSGAEPAEVFLDLFRPAGGGGEEPGTSPPRHVTSAEPAAKSLVHEIEHDGDYLLRIQPELLRSGTFTVAQVTQPALGFPVAGRSTQAVQSFFNDSRDGGRRDHHGVDIFAPRDTPVLAASDGVITSAGTNNLGGNVVWLWDPSRGLSQYYAHLEKQAVAAGQAVRAGDIVGFVGNSGNARTTPPHLHFGIYAKGEGPVDPLPFIRGASAPRISPRP